MKTRKYKRGGKVIASGGFGCVFSPLLWKFSLYNVWI